MNYGMEKIIDGRRYDTDKADLIFDWDNGRPESDFGWRIKRLYRSKHGAWFFVHRGGPSSDMAIPCGDNGRTGSSNLEAVSDDDAYRFLEAHSDDTDAARAIEQYFADRVVDA